MWQSRAIASLIHSTHANGFTHLVKTKTKTMTMTKIPYQKTCYAYGHGPLKTLLFEGGEGWWPWPRFHQQRLATHMVMVIWKFFFIITWIWATKVQAFSANVEFNVEACILLSHSALALGDWKQRRDRGVCSLHRWGITSEIFHQRLSSMTRLFSSEDIARSVLTPPTSSTAPHRPWFSGTLLPTTHVLRSEAAAQSASSGYPGTRPGLESRPPATGLRKPKSPEVPGRVLGRVRGKEALGGGLLGAVLFLRFSKASGLPAVLPAVPPALSFFPALFPALSPALLRIWACSALWQAA